MDREGFLGNVAFRIDVAVEMLTAGDAVDELDAADLDQPMPLIRVEAGGLGVLRSESASSLRHCSHGVQDRTYLCAGSVETL
jgi:hypothetical protein